MNFDSEYIRQSPHRLIRVVQTQLVCYINGGTSDFSPGTVYDGVVTELEVANVVGVSEATEGQRDVVSRDCGMPSDRGLSSLYSVSGTFETSTRQ
jgi:hypothetical protein